MLASGRHVLQKRLAADRIYTGLRPNGKELADARSAI